jgi:hypothetical protein
VALLIVRHTIVRQARPQVETPIEPAPEREVEASDEPPIEAIEEEVNV